jgi:hypothetical protein
MRVMKTKNKVPPPGMYRLTLTRESFAAVLANSECGFSPKVAFQRPDGKWDCAISFALADQLKTAALAGENLSDTVLRVMATQKGLN